MNFDLTSYLQYPNFDIDTFYDSFKTAYGNLFDEYEGISANVEKGESSIVVTVETDLDKVDDEAYKKVILGSENIEVSAKEFKSKFEEMDFTCKYNR